MPLDKKLKHRLRWVRGVPRGREAVGANIEKSVEQVRVGGQDQSVAWETYEHKIKARG